jgi:hypothetical protein
MNQWLLAVQRLLLLYVGCERYRSVPSHDSHCDLCCWCLPGPHHCHYCCQDWATLYSCWWQLSLSQYSFPVFLTCLQNPCQLSFVTNDTESLVTCCNFEVCIYCKLFRNRSPNVSSCESYRSFVTMYGGRQLCDCDLPIDRASLWSSVQELIYICQPYSSSCHPLHLSCRAVISYLLVLRTMTVVCQPGHNYWLRWKAGNKYLNYLLFSLLLDFSIFVSFTYDLLVQVQALKWLTDWGKQSINSSVICCIASLFPILHWCECPWLCHLANICEMLSCSLLTSYRCDILTVHYPSVSLIASHLLTYMQQCLLSLIRFLVLAWHFLH